MRKFRAGVAIRAEENAPRQKAGFWTAARQRRFEYAQKVRARLKAELSFRAPKRKRKDLFFRVSDGEINTDRSRSIKPNQSGGFYAFKAAKLLQQFNYKILTISFAVKCGFYRSNHA